MYPDLIVITGPTATGKTKFAVALANIIDAEIISADSRQVFKGMDIGTGKDIADYFIGNRHIPYHLIDILEAGQRYSVFRFQQDFFRVYDEIRSRGKRVILCGGTGLYVESVVSNYRLPDVPENLELRKQLANKTLGELADILSGLKRLHNKTDIDTCKRAIRAIEIATFEQENSFDRAFPPLETLIFGILLERSVIRQRITERLEQRLNDGMIDECAYLLERGVSADTLISYGLEYKYITWYLRGDISYADLVSGLNTAIHQFAKRQMTWFRRMERKGLKINWIDGSHGIDKMLSAAGDIIDKHNQ